jgi:hypothetical protein
MRKIARWCAILSLLALSWPAAAQVYPDMPANTVLGRVGTLGQATAIPFGTISQLLSGFDACGANVPAVGTAAGAPQQCWSNGALGSAAAANVGTSGNTVPTNSGGFTQSGAVNFTGSFALNGVPLPSFPASAIVGVSDTQTLTNKSVDGSEINSGTVPGAYMAAVNLGAAGNGGVTGSLALASIASIGADNILGNFTGASAAPTAGALVNCSNALTYSTSTHSFSCNTALGTGSLTEQKNTADATLTTSGNCDNTSTNATSPCQYAIALSHANTWAGLQTYNTGDLAINGGSATAGIATVTAGGVLSSATLTAEFDSVFGATQGSVLYRGASSWSLLAPGTSGYFLQTQGAAANPTWAAASGGTGCTTGGSAANMLVANGSGGCTTVTVSSLTNGALALGSSGTAGSVAMGNATTGTVTLQPVTGALGTVTASLPANTGTIGETNLAQTWSAVQTFNANDLLLAGVTGSTQCLNVNSSGVVSGTGAGCAPATSGTSILKGNGSGGFSNATAGTDYVAPGTSLPLSTCGGNCAANYSIQTSDCGLLVNETGTQKTVTLPAASGFTSGCLIIVHNGSSTRAQEITGFPDPRPLGSTYSAGTNFCSASCLWPNQTIAVQSNGSTWQLIFLNPLRYPNSVTPTVYVGCSSGVNGGSCGSVSLCSDANDGLTLGAPVCTIQQALNIIVGQFDRAGVNPWIELIPGASTASYNAYTGGQIVDGQSGHRSDGITIIGAPEATYTASVSSSVMTVTGTCAGTIHVGDYLFTPGGPIAGGYYVFSEGTGTGCAGTYNIGLAGSVTAPGNFSSQTVNSYIPNATRIVAPAGSAAIAAFDEATLFLTNLAVNCSNSGTYGVEGYQFSTVEINNVGVADCAGGSQIVAFNHGHIDIDNGLVIYGNAGHSIFWADAGGQIDTYNEPAVTCANALSASVFANATNGGQILMNTTTGLFNGCGSVTAQRWNADALGLIQTGGGGSTFFPGTTAGSTTNNSVYE